MATHSSILAWRIPGTGEPDGLPSVGSYRVGHDWSNLAAAAAVNCLSGSLTPVIFKFKHVHTHRKYIWYNFYIVYITPVLLPGKSHGRRSLVGCSPWSCEESDTTERLHFHFSLSCIREGNGNPLQCSCLENPKDGGAWWAAIHGVSQSQTWLKWLSSSSSIHYFIM